MLRPQEHILYLLWTYWEILRFFPWLSLMSTTLWSLLLQKGSAEVSLPNTRHLQLLVKWEVVSPNSRYREFYHEIGNIEKCLFTYWLNGGRWFLQIVDIHVGNFNMKLTGRWFPQIVDRDSGNLYPITWKKNCGVCFWTCSREISGDRVALFPWIFMTWYHFMAASPKLLNRCLYTWFQSSEGTI